MMRTDPDAILTTPGLRDTALKRGKEVFAENCASCHGADAKGSTLKAIPDMTDDDYLYGQNTPSDIEQIVLHGIRAGDTKGWNLADMPGYARAIPYAREKLPPLTPAQTDDLVAFLRAANGNGGYDEARVDRGRMMFKTTAGCGDCHGGDAGGDPAIGAPNLVDGKWLKGNGSEADIRHTLERGLAGVSPAFIHRLSGYDARVVAVYTASLHPPTKPAQ
ncbi:cbb3-type cytochrome c oxidase subunit III [Nitrospirillum viridazoti]|uniref:Cbb3-type cytochrome c oxidase subunit III n=2 Tax=Nitrospirillum TaxID=1543705 RepID=A0A560HM15_9PROT|nr:cbb3-type cytochrome c oxidase subunit III [Nitrospirillum amazonense]